MPLLDIGDAEGQQVWKGVLLGSAGSDFRSLN